jgi:hypothetical protein
MNKKIVLVDVGTHIGQEYKAIFQYSVLEYLYKFFKIRLISLVFRKKELNTIGLMESISIIRHAYQIRGKRNSFRIVFVEPNARLFGSKVYMNADRVYCLALGGSNESMTFAPLFFVGSDNLGQGSSLFGNKEGTEKDNCDYVVRCGAEHFARFLKEGFDAEMGKDKYQVILRINCEGSEDETIFAFKEVFSEQFQMVLGSLKDVGKLKGQTELNKLHAFIEDEGIKYIPFSSSYTTWETALLAIKDKLK